MLSLLSIKTAVAMSGLSFGHCCTHRRPTCIDLNTWDISLDLLTFSSINSNDLPSFKSFHAWWTQYRKILLKNNNESENWWFNSICNPSIVQEIELKLSFHTIQIILTPSLEVVISSTFYNQDYNEIQSIINLHIRECLRQF